MELNQQYEVTKEKYDLFKRHFKGCIAHRVDNGLYYVKALIFLGLRTPMTNLLNQ